MNENLRKAIDHLGIIERARGTDSSEAVLARAQLERMLKAAEQGTPKTPGQKDDGQEGEEEEEEEKPAQPELKKFISDKYPAPAPDPNQGWARVDHHPNYHELLTNHANQTWNDHLNGEDINLPGHDRSARIMSGSSFNPTDRDTRGNRVRPDRLYAHDANDTGEIEHIKGPDRLRDALHGQMSGTEIPDHYGREELKEWMKDPQNYSL